MQRDEDGREVWHGRGAWTQTGDVREALVGME